MTGAALPAAGVAGSAACQASVSPVRGSTATSPCRVRTITRAPQSLAPARFGATSAPPATPRSHRRLSGNLIIPRSGFGRGRDRDVVDHEVLRRSRWLTALVRLDRRAGDGVEHVLALDHLSEDRVILRQAVAEVRVDDEELGTLRVRTGVGH